MTMQRDVRTWFAHRSTRWFLICDQRALLNGVMAGFQNIPKSLQQMYRISRKLKLNSARVGGFERYI